jgi:NADPH:quinone reductase-like Zn-dependent oxidoreductase
LISDIVIGPFTVNDQVHQIRPIIDATYGFTELPEALEHLDRGPFGKVVLEAR